MRSRPSLLFLAYPLMLACPEIFERRTRVDGARDALIAQTIAPAICAAPWQPARRRSLLKWRLAGYALVIRQRYHFLGC